LLIRANLDDFRVKAMAESYNGFTYQAKINNSYEQSL
jgi:hypothetical protein